MLIKQLCVFLIDNISSNKSNLRFQAQLADPAGNLITRTVRRNVFLLDVFET